MAQRPKFLRPTEDSLTGELFDVFLNWLNVFVQKRRSSRARTASFAPVSDGRLHSKAELNFKTETLKIDTWNKNQITLMRTAAMYENTHSVYNRSPKWCERSKRTQNNYVNTCASSRTRTSTHNKVVPIRIFS